MSQHDYNIANGGGAAVRADINNALLAILSQNSGATAPAVTKPFMFWYDTTTGVLKMRNAADTAWVDAITGVSGGNGLGMVNRIINGDGVVTQRASSAALTTTAAYVSCDRWFALQETAAASTFGVSSTGLSAGTRQQMALNRNNGSSGTGRISAGQIIESSNIIDCQGSTATFSFTARAGANFSASGSSIQVQVYSGTTADQGIASLQGGSWAGLTAILDTTQAITTTNTKYTFNCNVPSGCKEIAVFLRFTPTGTAGADDTLYFTNVDFRKGTFTTAPAWDWRPYGTELALCQRYFISYGGSNAYERFGTCICGSTTNAIAMMIFPVEMRSAPTFSYSSIANLGIYSGAAVLSVSAVGGDSPSPKIGMLSLTATGLVTGATYQFLANNTTSARATWSAEL